MEIFEAPVFQPSLRWIPPSTQQQYKYAYHLLTFGLENIDTQVLIMTTCRLENVIAWTEKTQERGIKSVYKRIERERERVRQDELCLSTACGDMINTKEPWMQLANNKTIIISVTHQVNSYASWKSILTQKCISENHIINLSKISGHSSGGTLRIMTEVGWNILSHWSSLGIKGVVDERVDRSRIWHG